MAHTKIQWHKDPDNVHRPTGICTICNTSFKSENIFASKYCSSCSIKINKEKTKERVRKYRERKKGISL